MKNKKIINYLLTFFVISIISFIISFLIYNFNVLKLPKSSRILKTVSTSDINYFKDKIVIDYKGYVNKIIIYHNSMNDVCTDLSYNTKNYYGIKSKEQMRECFYTKIKKSVIPIKNNVNRVTIDTKKNPDIVFKKVIVNNKVSINFYLWLFIFITLLLFYTFYLYFKGKIFEGKIEKLFLFVAISIGSLFIVLQPHTTSYSWDDQIHFYNIYKVFELDGSVEWTQGDTFMTEIYPFGSSINTYEEMNAIDAFISSKRKVVNIENTSPLITYNQVGYIIPGFFMKVCFLLGFGTTTSLLVSKFSMLLFYSIVVYFAIKIIPRGKRILSVIGLLPTVLFLSTEFSYDSPIIAGVCLFVAKYLSIMENKKEKVDLNNCLILLCSIIFASFIKAIYIPFILLLLFIPMNKFNNDKQARIFKIGTILIFIMIVLTFVLPNVSGGDGLGDIRGGNTSTSQQIHNIIEHPLGYAELLKDTAGYHFLNYLIGRPLLINYSYVGSPFYDDNLYFLLVCVLLFVIFTDSYKNKISKKDNIIRLFNVVLVLGIIVLIWTALYASFTPVGETVINGVQARYFIPLIPPLALITLTNTKIRHSFEMLKYDTIIMSIIVFVLLYSLYIFFYLQFCL